MNTSTTAGAAVNCHDAHLPDNHEDLDPPTLLPATTYSQVQHPQQSHSQSQSQSRRPSGFAATAAGNGSSAKSNTAKARRKREKEKERTMLRERHRRAITSRMLAGFRQYGNFPLPARADVNDVLAALARGAGWVVEVDGTTYRKSQPVNNNNSYNLGAYPVKSVESPISSSSLRNFPMKTYIECQPPVLRIDESLSPASLDSVIVAEGDLKVDKYTTNSPISTPGCLEVDQLIHEVHSGEPKHDFAATAYVPVYVTLSAGFINSFCQLMNAESIKQELQNLKSLHVEGIVVDCWWGIVEGWAPQKYEWSGYRELFNIIKEFEMKLQVVMAFHEHGGHDSGGICSPLPQWVLDIGKNNQDIFFTDREGRRNTECLSWGVDKERVLRGRTGIEVYFDFMRSFRTEFDDFFREGLISGVEIGLGPFGELRYPAFPERMGWRYPGIGEFQCYDKYLLKNLQKAARLRGHSFWARGPDNAGYYNSRPNETAFFCERGDYDTYYGRFFLRWYSQVLVDHADNVLSLARLPFEDITIIVKIPAIYWWFKTTSHAAELTSGYSNSTNQDGYSAVFEVLKKHSVIVKFLCPGVNSFHEVDEPLADPEGLSWQVLNSAWDKGLSVAGQNAISCYDREGFMRLIDIAKPKNDPDLHHFLFFVFDQSPLLVQRALCLSELDHIVNCMHGM